VRRLVRLLPVHVPAAEAAAWQLPLLTRMLDVAIAIGELSACAFHMRIEVAGVRGLLLLLTWRDSCGGVLAYRCSPHESGLFSRRYCEVEEFDALQNLFTRRGLTWADALREFAIPLRALAAFHSKQALRRVFELPPWAIADIHALPCNLPHLAIDLVGGGAVGGADADD